MQYFRDKFYPTSVKGKILAGFLLAFVAILLALGITHFGFREMMDTVNELSAPNPKLNTLNDIFQEITALDQTQRAEAIRNPKKPYKAFLKQTTSLSDKIDSLRLLKWDSAQQSRLLNIKQVLQKRNSLFFAYLKLKSTLTDNRRLSVRLDTLSTILQHEKILVDTSVVTTEKKTITTYTRDSVPAQKERSGLGKLFGKKKNNTAPTTHIKVQEELSVTVDTLAVARQNKAIDEVEKIMTDLENDQRAENKKLLQQELELIHANSLLINKLLSILHEVEKEELAHMRDKNDRAVALVTKSISNIGFLLVAFFLGAALLVYLIWVDIGRSNYYKEQLEKAKDEAEELSQIKQRFLANMSHEIRTPLQSIIGFAEQLKQRQGTLPEAIDAIHSSSEHLLHIVDEVLDYSRISSGSFTLQKENFSLRSLLSEVEAALRVQAHRKHLTLLLEVEQPNGYLLHGDAFRLRQILYNLVGNAIKFTTKGYVKLAVKTIENDGDIRCVFEISDTGIGIQREDLEKIFNQFEQANALIARHYGGTGLGLTIVKSLVEAQGGTLDVHSESGMGSTFTVTLPFDRADGEAVRQPLKEKATKQSFTGKVIVVDDDLMILRLCSLILQKHEVDFTTYSEAEKLIHEKPQAGVSHILMDIRMPHINGVELCRALKKTYPPATRFVALTAHVFPQERQQLLDEGFDVVLSKPFREHELMDVLGIATDMADTIETDLSTLRLMTMGDEALFQSVLQQFMDETKTDVVNLEKHLKHMQAGPVREIVHKLAGRIGQMGSSDLSTTLRDIEVKLQDEVPLSDLLPALTQAKDDVEALLMNIQVNTLSS
ncbi:ATP-binding protein [Chryseolinea lacunae]|uniref:histidine kinase n=1 Tax=Chryseolinea lacunae TaxID=2801331 RepID=A0ABS1KPD6_9BACT|nr:ATP-binding protein [Chryseolinea lacunae]MBL0741309.1 response regulator [Chryseolinea lacunae]